MESLITLLESMKERTERIESTSIHGGQTDTGPTFGRSRERYASCLMCEPKPEEVVRLTMKHKQENS